MSDTIICQIYTFQTVIPIRPSKTILNSSITKNSPSFLLAQRVVQGKKIYGLKWSTQKRMNVIIMRDKGQNRGPLWRGRLLSNEAIQAVQALRRAKKDTDKLEKAFQTKISRLLKRDLLSVLSELQRQDQCDLALQRQEEFIKSWQEES